MAGNGEHSVQKRWAIRETRARAARGQGVSRPGGRCSQPVQALLGVLDQVLHAAVQGDRPKEQAHRSLKNSVKQRGSSGDTR